MRLWSLHPLHLDRIGLVAGWREALLAQAVLAGRTTGYRSHPQVLRFFESPEPIEAIGGYLNGLAHEADRRGYRFDRKKILASPPVSLRLSVTSGQLEYEWKHLGDKLVKRSPDDAQRWRSSTPTPHPLFTPAPGAIENWERP